MTIIWSLLAGNAVVDSEFSSSHFGVYIEQEIQKECTTNAGLASSSGLSELRLPCSLWVLAMLADILHGRVDCGESASAVQSSAFAVAIGGAMDSWNSRYECNQRPFRSCARNK